MKWEWYQLTGHTDSENIACLRYQSRRYVGWVGVQGAQNDTLGVNIHVGSWAIEYRLCLFMVDLCFCHGHKTAWRVGVSKGGCWRSRFDVYLGALSVTSRGVRRLLCDLR